MGKSSGKSMAAAHLWFDSVKDKVHSFVTPGPPGDDFILIVPAQCFNNNFNINKSL